jgi:hypothetical protein
MKPFTLDENNKIEHGFAVPENYFEQFHQIDFSSPSPKLIRLNPMKNEWFWAAAAVLAIGFSFTYFTFSGNDSNEIDVQTTENYLVYETDLNSDELAEYLNEEEIDNFKLIVTVSN